MWGAQRSGWRSLAVSGGQWRSVMVGEPAANTNFKPQNWLEREKCHREMSLRLVVSLARSLWAPADNQSVAQTGKSILNSLVGLSEATTIMDKDARQLHQRQPVVSARLAKQTPGWEQISRPLPEIRNNRQRQPVDVLTGSFGAPVWPPEPRGRRCRRDRSWWPSIRLARAHDCAESDRPDERTKQMG